VQFNLLKAEILIPEQ